MIPRETLEHTQIRRPPLGEILLRLKAVTAAQVEVALAKQQEEFVDAPRRPRVGELLVESKACTIADVARALGIQSGLPYVEDIDARTVDPELLANLPISFAKGNELIPVRRVDGAVEVATANPLNLLALDDLRVLLGAPIKTIITPPKVILDTINAAYDRRSTAADAMMEGLEETGDLGTLAHELQEPQDLLDADDEAPIIRLVNSLLFQAVKERATDIHITPEERDIWVRFRVDGVMREVIRPPKRFQASIVSRVKIMAGLNIAEKRLPQDGRIRIKLAGKDVDIRVATVPHAHGEKITMRLLEKTSTVLRLNEIGVAGEKLDQLRKLIQADHGMILVTGPTGAGKSTTLYAGLSEINTPDLNIITIEDPIEYQLKGVTQIQVNPKIDLTFANGLRSILRNDPDVIMVGEIRDGETADIAINAALTGHLVFSTIHTNDAAATFARLIDMGVEPFLVADSVIAVIAQRLVRVLCDDCKKPHQPLPEELAEIGVTLAAMKGKTIYEAVGCPVCSGIGYRGRTGIYELLVVDPDIKGLIVQRVESGVIARKAVAKGMQTLRDDGAIKVLEGVTTIAEVLRSTQLAMVSAEGGPAGGETPGARTRGNTEASPR